MTQLDDALAILKIAATEVTKAEPFSVSAQQLTRAIAAIAPAIDVDRRAAVYDARSAARDMVTDFGADLADYHERYAAAMNRNVEEVAKQIEGIK